MCYINPPMKAPFQNYLQLPEKYNYVQTEGDQYALENVLKSIIHFWKTK